MELQKFVKNTLLEIQRGINDAINEKQEGVDNWAINPVFGNENDIANTHLQEVKFDIAVTISETASNLKGAGIQVVGFNIGGKKGNKNESQNVSRIQFSIPIIPSVELVHKSDTPKQNHY